MAYMNQITRNNIAKDHLEIPTRYHWVLNIDSWPSAVYYPGDGIFQIRLIEATPPLPALTNGIVTEKVHGQEVHQYGDTEYSGELQCVFRDFVDQSIANIFYDWNAKIMDPQTRLGLPKSTLIMDATLLQLDRKLNAIKSWEMKTGLLSSFTSGENYGGEVTNQPVYQVNIKFEYVVPHLLNQ